MLKGANSTLPSQEKRMGFRKRHIFTMDQMREAIKGCQGNTSVIAAALNCDWHTADRNMRDAEYRSNGQARSLPRAKKEVEELVSLFDNELQMMGDFTESKAYEAVQKGSEQMIRYMLSTKFRNRGYEQNPVLKIDNQEPLNISFDGMTKQDLLQADNVEAGTENDE